MIQPPTGVPVGGIPNWGDSKMKQEPGFPILVVVTALLASIGAAGIPSAGLVMISIILGTVGLPLEGVALILAVDPLLDMLRTSVNIFSDSCGAVVVAHHEGETNLYPDAGE